jgi:hypothetical protein
MDQISPLPALTQDEVRVEAWAEVREPLELQLLRENPELRAATLPAVRSALAAHDGPDGIRLNAATWVVTARAPAGL